MRSHYEKEESWDPIIRRRRVEIPSSEGISTLLLLIMGSQLSSFWWWDLNSPPSDDGNSTLLLLMMGSQLSSFWWWGGELRSHYQKEESWGPIIRRRRVEVSSSEGGELSFHHQKEESWGLAKKVKSVC
jgi:hypothetical protein